jgi:RimJ/RimL family protein N-acetyltransferase
VIPLKNYIILPIIQTKRLLLRPIKVTDKEAVFSYAKDPKVGPLAGWEPHQSIDDSLKFIEYAIRKREYGQPGVYAMVLKETNEMVGSIEIHSYQVTKAAIGFVLHPNYWNQGFVTEAAKALIIYAMEVLGLRRLEYCHFPHNHASKRVCEKLGFTYEGVLRNKYLMYDGSVLDDVVYSITSEDYTSGKIEWVQETKKHVLID